MAEIKTYGVALPVEEMFHVVNTGVPDIIETNTGKKVVNITVNVGSKLLATAKKYKSLLGVHQQQDYIYFLFRLRAEATDFLAEAEEQGYHPWARGVAYVDTKDMPKEM